MKTKKIDEALQAHLALVRELVESGQASAAGQYAYDLRRRAEQMTADGKTVRRHADAVDRLLRELMPTQRIDEVRP